MPETDDSTHLDLGPVDRHWAHPESFVIIGASLAVIAYVLLFSVYRLAQGFLRRQGGRYTPGEHRILWALLIASSGFVGLRLHARLTEGDFRVRDLGVAPLLAYALFWSAGWWKRAERERYAEYDHQDAQALAAHQAKRAQNAENQGAAGPAGGKVKAL